MFSAVASVAPRDPGRGAGVGEVGKESRVVPVGNAGEEDGVERHQGFFPGGRFLRTGFGQLRENLARSSSGQHGIVARRREVLADPVDYLIAASTELFRIEVAEVTEIAEIVGVAHGRSGYSNHRHHVRTAELTEGFIELY